MEANGTECMRESAHTSEFAPVFRPDAPAVAAASLLSHRLVVLQLLPLHSNQECVESGKHISDIIYCDVQIIYWWLDFNHISSA